MRDYLLLRVIVGSRQRCGAASNLMLKEFQDGVWAESKGKRIFVTRTLRHKTLSGGLAKLMWDKELKAFADTYIKKLRTLPMRTMLRLRAYQRGHCFSFQAEEIC